MPGQLKEVRTRIQSVNNTQQITKAMKLVSAAKLKRAQTNITQIRPYANRQKVMLANVLQNIGDEVNVSFGKERKIKNATIVVITSDKGLCGGFNSNILKSAKKLLNEQLNHLYEAGKISMIFIGKKGYEAFKRDTKLNLIDDHVNILHDLSFAKAAKLADSICDKFEHGKTDAVYVCYAKFKNAAMQSFEAEKYLPVNTIENNKENLKTNSHYLFEPDLETLVQELVPKILKTTFYSYILDNIASEHGARMTAMENATNNAEEILKQLKVSYNRARQAAITTELTEIVAGAASLEG
jgi:F-type H+-transporting ATPase subunit gamma